MFQCTVHVLETFDIHILTRCIDVCPFYTENEMNELQTQDTLSIIVIFHVLYCSLTEFHEIDVYLHLLMLYLPHVYYYFLLMISTGTLTA